MATGKNHTGIFKKILVDFIGQEDPILAMLEWTAQQMMQIEAEAKVGAQKGKHSQERKTYFSGTRVRRMDTRLGTVYLFICMSSNDSDTRLSDDFASSYYS